MRKTWKAGVGWKPCRLDSCRDVCIVINDAAPCPLLQGSEFDIDKAANVELKPQVVVVDSNDAASVPLGEGEEGPHIDLTRAQAQGLSQLPN